MNVSRRKTINNGKKDSTQKKKDNKISSKKIVLSIPQSNCKKSNEPRIYNNNLNCRNLFITTDVPKNQRQKSKNNINEQKVTQNLSSLNNKLVFSKDSSLTQKIIMLKNLQKKEFDNTEEENNEYDDGNNNGENLDNDYMNDDNVYRSENNNNSGGIKRSYSCGERNKYGDVFIKKKPKDEFRHSFLLDNLVEEPKKHENENNVMDTEKYVTYLNDNVFNPNNINIYKKINPKAHINFFNLNMNFNVNYTDNDELNLQPYLRNLSARQRKHDNLQDNNNRSITSRDNNNIDNENNNAFEENCYKTINTFYKPKQTIESKDRITQKKAHNSMNFIKNPPIIKKEYFNNNSRNIENYDNNQQINLDDFLFIIHKIDSIKNNLIIFINNCNLSSSKELLEFINSIRIKSYDLFIFYLSCSFEGMPQNYLSSSTNRKNNFMNYYSIILILSLGIFYIITQKIKMTKDYKDKLLKLINIQEKMFLILCDAVIQKIKNNINGNNFVFNQLKQEIASKNISNILANSNSHILQIKILSIDSYKIINDILFNIYSFSDKTKNNTQELFMYKYFHNKDISYLSKIKITEIEEIFNKNVFSVMYLKSNYANITSLKGITKNKNHSSYYSLEENNNTVKVPYLDFKPLKELTLVIDLDETMISFNFIESEQGLGKMRLRPGLEEFLEIIRDYYEIIVFTSGTKDYADTILDIIEKKKNKKYFSGRLYREHTTQIDNKYVKDLSKLGRDLSKTLIVDNLPHCFKLQRENGILIKSFFTDNKNDKALFELQRILINIYYDKIDVRKSLIKYREDILKNVTCIDDIN